MNVALGQLNERGIEIGDYEVEPARLAGLVQLADGGKMTAQVAREVLGKMIETGKDAAAIVKEEGAEQISDEDALAPVVDEVLAANAKMAQDYLGGKQAAVGALVGQVMKATRGKADPKLAGALLRRKLDAMG